MSYFDLEARKQPGHTYPYITTWSKFIEDNPVRNFPTSNVAYIWSDELGNPLYHVAATHETSEVFVSRAGQSKPEMNEEILVIGSFIDCTQREEVAGPWYDTHGGSPKVADLENLIDLFSRHEAHVRFLRAQGKTERPPVLKKPHATYEAFLDADPRRNVEPIVFGTHWRSRPDAPNHALHYFPTTGERILVREGTRNKTRLVRPLGWEPDPGTLAEQLEGWRDHEPEGTSFEWLEQALRISGSGLFDFRGGMPLDYAVQTDRGIESGISFGDDWRGRADGPSFRLRYSQETNQLYWISNTSPSESSFAQAFETFKGPLDQVQEMLAGGESRQGRPGGVNWAMQQIVNHDSAFPPSARRL